MRLSGEGASLASCEVDTHNQLSPKGRKVARREIVDIMVGFYFGPSIERGDRPAMTA